jgi:hypothetical protein
MADKREPNTGGSELLLYQAEDGKTRIQVRLEDETVWLTQQMMADLFQTTKQNISLHVQKVLEEHELPAISTVKQYLTVQREGSREVKRSLEFYNLDMVISVGYRVRSHVATRFRIWATQRLREYIVKGFALDDERLKQAGGGNYFDELLARIRDIRSAEKVFWRKVLDIYALSADYDPNTDLSQKFFAVVQNKMHWAAHGHTAAEIVAARADAAQPNMGLTSWTGSKPSRADAEIAKNYLAAPELDALNRIVSLYLDFAELQAMSRRVMYMRDWITKLDDFLRLSERDILSHAGTVSHDDAVAKARREFERYHTAQISAPSPVEQDFERAVEKVKRLEAREKESLPAEPRSARNTRKGRRHG